MTPFLIEHRTEEVDRYKVNFQTQLIPNVEVQSSCDSFVASVLIIDVRLRQRIWHHISQVDQVHQ